MGLLKAIFGATGGVLADQWKEYFYCEAIPADVIVTKGQKKITGRSSNKHGDENIITQGSKIVVADGQCMIIVDQGKVAEVCAEPGEYTYDASTEPSIFCGNFGKGLKESFSNIGKRFTFGGEAPKDQRIYYINTKEIMGNKYGTPNPVPFRVVDQRAAIDIDISLRCFGVYSFRISDPVLFYTNVCGNVSENFTRDNIEGQLKTEFLTKLQPALARISAMGIRYSQVPAHTVELSQAMKTELHEEWEARRGIQIGTVGVSSISATEEDEKMLKEMQRNVAYMDPARGAAALVGATASAMDKAAGNAGGAAVGFMGMNMAGGAATQGIQGLYAQASKDNVNNSGSAQVQSGSWKCSCGSVSTGKFCTECGKPKPEASFWICSCGAKNKGKFCIECGARKPDGIPQYKCDKCGWEPEKGSKPPKFCPECGDPFDDGDIVR